MSCGPGCCLFMESPPPLLNALPFLPPPACCPKNQELFSKTFFFIKLFIAKIRVLF